MWGFMPCSWGLSVGICIYFRIRVRQGRKEEAVMLGKKLLEEMNTLELSDVWERDYTLSVLQDMIGVETRITLFK